MLGPVSDDLAHALPEHADAGPQDADGNDDAEVGLDVDMKGMGNDDGRQDGNGDQGVAHGLGPGHDQRYVVQPFAVLSEVTDPFHYSR